MTSKCKKEEESNAILSKTNTVAESFTNVVMPLMSGIRSFSERVKVYIVRKGYEPVHKQKGFRKINHYNY